MSHGLFIRSYPARGAEIIPASYPAGFGGYFLVCLAPVYALSFFIVFLYIGFRQPWVYEGFVASALCVLVALSLLRRMRLQIRTDGISYTGMFRAERFVAFSEISTVVFIDYQHARSQAYPQRTPLSWTAILTPNVETGKVAVKIPLSLFPSTASREMTRLLRPEIWESGS